MEELQNFVRKFFKKLDAEEFDGFLSLFTEDADIAHPDGILQTPTEFIQELRTKGMRRPVGRILSDFRGGIDGDLGWIAYRNNPDFGDGKLSFLETAVLRKGPGGWRFTRVHYSG